jgi:primosomal protein N' (replication factor Y)
MIAFRIQGLDENQVNLAAKQLRTRVSSLAARLIHENQLWVLGPVEAPLARLRNQFRMQLLVKSVKGLDLSRLARRTLEDEKWVPRGVRVMVDVDPMNLM